VQRDGTVGTGKLFADMSAGKGTGNPDGMKFDEGNLYPWAQVASGCSRPMAGTWA
jgi:hypothetical protein